MFRRSGRRDRDSGLLTAASLPAPCNLWSAGLLSQPGGQALHTKPNLAPLSLAGLVAGLCKDAAGLWVS